MIQKIHLKNYKSFKDFEFEVKEYKDSNNIYLIYGENGAGKSNLISSVFFLYKLIRSLNLNEWIRDVISKENSEIDIRDIIHDFLNLNQIENILKEVKRIGSESEMELSYVFSIDEKEFEYTLAFDNEKVVYESLYAPIVKNKVSVYEIIYRDEIVINFNANLFKGAYQKEVKELVKKYFGKHTFLSIIFNEGEKKNLEYLESNTDPILLDFITYIFNISILYKEGINSDEKIIYTDSRILKYLEKGNIDDVKDRKLKKTEELLNIYFKSLYADVKQVFYKTTPKDDKFEYELYFKKMIGGGLVDVPFNVESRGTKKLLELFPFFVKLINGGIVVIDELESGVHDVLISLLMERLGEVKFKGQLIATTHNTMLLDIINKNQIYMLDIDDLGNKAIYNLRDSGVKIQRNHSVYNNYRKGLFGGIPTPGFFDFNDLNDCLEEKENASEL